MRVFRIVAVYLDRNMTFRSLAEAALATGAILAALAILLAWYFGLLI
jgi:hypothetical protein